MNYKLFKEDQKGLAALIENEAITSQMTFTTVSPMLIIINHTEVDDHLRGQGVGRSLLDLIVADARENDYKIMPLCPYAKSVFDKDENIADVLYQNRSAKG